MYFLPEKTILPLPILIPQVVALAILFTWIYNNTRGSLAATVLTHFGFNFCGAFLAGTLGLMPPMLLYFGGGAMAVILTVVVVLVFGARSLSRKPRAELPFRSAGLAEGLPLETRKAELRNSNENARLLLEREGREDRVFERGIRARIHDQRVASLGEHDRVPGRALGCG